MSHPDFNNRPAYLGVEPITVTGITAVSYRYRRAGDTKDYFAKHNTVTLVPLTTYIVRIEFVHRGCHSYSMYVTVRTVNSGCKFNTQYVHPNIVATKWSELARYMEKITIQEVLSHYIAGTREPVKV